MGIDTFQRNLVGYNNADACIIRDFIVQHGVKPVKTSKE